MKRREKLGRVRLAAMAMVLLVGGGSTVRARSLPAMGPQAGLATIGHNAQAEPLTFAERVEERMQWSGRPTVEGSWSETRLLLLFGLTLFGGAGLCVAQAARVQRSQESVRLAQSSH